MYNTKKIKVPCKLLVVKINVAKVSATGTQKTRVHVPSDA